MFPQIIVQIPRGLLFSPILVAPSSHVLHCSKATGNPSEAIQVVQDGATCLQVVRVSCGLRKKDKHTITTEDSTAAVKKDQLIVSRDRNTELKLLRKIISVFYYIMFLNF